MSNSLGLVMALRMRRAQIQTHCTDQRTGVMTASGGTYLNETERRAAADWLRGQLDRGEIEPDLAAYFLARLEDLKSPLIRFAPLGVGEGPFLTPDERMRLAVEIRQELTAGTLSADSQKAQLLPALENVLSVPFVWRSDIKDANDHG
ncbi:hypothetical protein [Thiomonas bhubaneswarensis]|nr:hypothetical protein [Thiomonas bhubaneswarensis]